MSAKKPPPAGAPCVTVTATLPGASEPSELEYCLPDGALTPEQIAEAEARAADRVESDWPGAVVTSTRFHR